MRFHRLVAALQLARLRSAAFTLQNRRRCERFVGAGSLGIYRRFCSLKAALLFEPLMKAGKWKEAEAILDKALKILTDPK